MIVFFSLSGELSFDEKACKSDQQAAIQLFSQIPSRCRGWFVE
jgi:hypothetical protein